MHKISEVVRETIFYPKEMLGIGLEQLAKARRSEGRKRALRVPLALKAKSWDPQKLAGR